MKKLFLKFSPFWVFLVLFKFGGGLHYSLLSPLGARLLPLWIVGLLMGGATFVETVLDVPAGRLLDRYGYRFFLKITTVFFVLAAVCLAFPLTKTTYLLSIFFSIFGWLFFTPGINAYILSAAPRENAGRFISLRDVFSSVGIVFASAALPFVLLLAQPHIGLLLVLVLGAAFVALSFAPPDRRVVHAEEPFPAERSYARRKLSATLAAVRRLNPASTILLLVYFASGIFYGMIWFTVPLVIVAQAQNTILGLGLGIFDLSVVVLGYVLGTLADRANRRTLVFFGLLIFSIFGMLLGADFGWLFLLFGFLATSGEEMAELSLWSWMHSLDREHAEDGTIAGAINLFDDLGWSIGPIVAGVAYGFIGPSWTIVLGALPILAIWLIYRSRFHRHLPEHIPLGSIPKKPHRFRHKS